jgi:L-threonylcarbamoyladenylate synthase
MEEEVRMAVEFLKKGKIILYPTDTVWGIGCDATNSKAVEKVYKIKQRFEKKSLIVLLDTIEKIPQYVEEVPPIAYDLMKSMDAPLTIIYPKAKNLAKNVIADDKSIAIRIVHDEFCRNMLEAFGKPVVSTSANISGEKAPLVFSKISEEIRNSVDYIVGINQQVMNRTKPSTIIRLRENNQFEIIRK